MTKLTEREEASYQKRAKLIPKREVNQRMKQKKKALKHFKRGLKSLDSPAEVDAVKAKIDYIKSDLKDLETIKKFQEK